MINLKVTQGTLFTGEALCCGLITGHIPLYSETVDILCATPLLRSIHRAPLPVRMWDFLEETGSNTLLCRRGHYP